MFRRIFLVALIAGTAAGLLVAVVQRVKVIPLISAAEVYETAAAHTGHSHDGAAADHHHPAPAATEADQEWEPAAGLERTAYTILANLLAGIGFALILSGAVAFARLRGHVIDAGRGLLWGIAGFTIFSFAPATGLPPELPGMAAADLVARQEWWLITASATAAGLAMIVFGRGGVIRVAALAVLLIPHLVGAPTTPHVESTLPAALAAEFVTASLATTLLFWLALGSLSGWLYQRFDKAAQRLTPRRGARSPVRGGGRGR
jgi:cobalt transporter subunit CbtA